MGILRLYLALCVVAVHASDTVLPWRMHDGMQAVQIFFIISGFYMGMILSGKYKTKRSFYLSRFLRIFPTYYVVLFMVVGISLASGVISGDYIELAPIKEDPMSKNGFLGVFVSTLTNFTIFFQELVLFFQHDIGTKFSATVNFRTSVYPLYKYLLIPQAWAISLELTFYLIAPYLVKRKTSFLIGIFLFSIAGRVYAYRSLGLQHDPWVYRFFPFEIAWFIIGILGWRLYQIFTAKRPSFNLTIYSGLIFVYVLITGLFFHIQGTVKLSGLIGYHYAIMVTYLFWPAIIGLLFFLTKNSKLDRLLGELAYPIYLCHLLIIFVLSLPLGQAFIPPHFKGEVAALISVLCSIVLLVLVIFPMDKIRHRMVLGKVQMSPSEVDLLKGIKR